MLISKCTLFLKEWTRNKETKTVALGSKENLASFIRLGDNVLYHHRASCTSHIIVMVSSVCKKVRKTMKVKSNSGQRKKPK